MTEKTRCLCCQKRLAGEKGKYHNKCLIRLFGVSWLPRVPFSIPDLPARISKVAGRMSISGVQPKVIVKLNRDAKELDIAVEGSTHILKTEPADFPELPQNENLCMNIAKMLDMDVPFHALIQMADEKLCYVVSRFDRYPDGVKIHKEDMAQLLQLFPEDKYRGSLEQVGKIIRKYATNRYLDLINFFERIILCFIIGNGDMHLKNWAIITLPDKMIKLAPCYDFVSSSLYLPGEEESALTINGKKNELTRSDFEALAKNLDIDIKAAKNVINKILKAKDDILEMIQTSELSWTRKENMANIVLSRLSRLNGF